MQPEPSPRKRGFLFLRIDVYSVGISTMRLKQSLQDLSMGQQSALSGVAGPRSQTQLVIRSAASQSREIRTPMIDDPHDCI
jgi:hypothetical protein